MDIADLVPRFGSNADVQLTKQTSTECNAKFSLNKHCDKGTYYALTLV